MLKLNEKAKKLEAKPSWSDAINATGSRHEGAAYVVYNTVKNLNNRMDPQSAFERAAANENLYGSDPGVVQERQIAANALRDLYNIKVNAQYESKKESYRLVDPSTEIAEYDEEDFLIKDARSGGVEVFNASDRSGNLGYFSDMEDAVEAIYDWMNREGFYPNIWYQNDHGNIDLVLRENTSKKEEVPMKKVITIQQEWQVPGTNVVLEEGDQITVVSDSGETMSGDGPGANGPMGKSVDRADEPEANPAAEKDTEASAQGKMDENPGETLDGEGTGDMAPMGKGIDRADSPFTTEFETVTLGEDWHVPGTNVVLEAGDTVQIMSETTNEIEMLIRNVLNNTGLRGEDAAKMAANRLGSSISVVAKQSMPASMSRVFIKTLSRAIQ